MTEPCLYTIDQLRERLAYWQRVLRLQDWDIQISIARMSTFEKQGSAAEVHTYERTRTVRIKILDPEDYAGLNPAALRPQDMEYSIVHELMHVVIYACTVSFDSHPKAELLEEQCVHNLTTAVLSLTRVPLATVGVLPELYTPLPLDLVARPHLAVSNPEPSSPFHGGPHTLTVPQNE